MNFHMIFAIAIFAVVYVFITTEYINKTIAVLVGSALVIILGVINKENVFNVIDWNVIFLLISMMIIVGITKRSGLFQYVAIKASKIAKGDPVKIIIMLFIITGLFSAFLDNVTTVLILTPVTILIAVELGLSPIPFIISQAIASNIGGTATLIGDPPNIMIGSAIGLSFNDFITNQSLIVIIMMIVTLFVVLLKYKKQLIVTQEKKARIMDFNENKAIKDFPLLIKSLIVLALVISGFILHDTVHLDASIIALSGASLLMLLSVFPKNEKSEEIAEEFYKEVEWGTIFFFIGLFILVDGLVQVGVIKKIAEYMIDATKGNIFFTTNIILWASGFFSAFIDNIPYVATMIPILKEVGNNIPFQEMEPVWWALSVGACIGGNGTLIGASANVVSAGIAKKSGYNISFIEFTKIGGITTVINLFVATIYFYIRYFMFT
ncbi:MAG: hypothetical protein A2015_06860 [Spirochaetes bacterium GWF1_31_7]|nr:MAG: hypothetical protein A2Y30_09600 [Spirochaetes bacterium GWE1_32_154]OHD46551.1 MAG: hypothetical protein A2015_06860 [Spirochaetes bacterium GWF1_31_7]OHD49360.1 MAG: hypothetical protein A2Y29_03855 [Spirochaetes bacterium GWE2_31_10]OHD82389.1 MAG: hypothetical protein A2355_06820 [Spirochaetes bacterium RIFOXYB1_FULL_32_8]HBD93100.1 hypothetical protein [Spirochaetia bacterium]